MNDDARRPDIPEPVARELRQLSGFGCCRCGSPILQYHHIIPYATEKHFRVKDMMALCPMCHDMATKHAFTQEQQRECQLHPFNIIKGYTDGKLILNGKFCVIQVGDVYIAGQGPLISVDGQSLISLSISPTNQLELSISLYDKKDRVVAVINKNEWVSGNVMLWDIRSDYQKLSINKKHGQIELEVNTQKDAISIKARLWYKKQSIRLSSIGLTIDGSAGRNIKFQNLGFVNQRFEIDSVTKEVSIVPNTGGGILISEPDPKLRLLKTIDASKSFGINK